MHNSEELKILIKEYEKSIIQSEAEVRSKFIVPLLDFLEYPSELRAEEFPVYGFEGGKKLPAKNADFIIFLDKDFGKYRTFNHKNIDWVQNNSILVVEAKKPGEMPEVLGQPVYYTIWTKAVAYLATDGDVIKGYFHNAITSDTEVIDCRISELLNHDMIWNFSYQNIMSIKKSGVAISEANDVRMLKKAAEEMKDNHSVRISDEEFTLPKELLDYMRQALGRNAEGLEKSELANRFFGLTDMYLEHGMRYDIPGYMFDFPREIHNALFYIQCHLVKHFYRCFVNEMPIILISKNFKNITKKG